jgi:CDP-glucose 4,6-dehydratase
VSWSGRKVLVTGHTGFKGAWLARWLERVGADVTGLALPADDPAGIGAMTRVRGSHVDIRDREATAAAITGARPDVVFHLAAQPLVRRSYERPLETYETNVLGTLHVLDGAAAAGAGAVVVVTTDKVYRQDGTPRAFVEADPLGGDDPYSASKAAAELLVAEWARRHRAQVRVSTARAGNVIGGGDRGVDRLLPDLVRAAESGAPAAIRNPGATRPWQHVLDPLAGYLVIAERLLDDGAAVPPAVNLGPDRASAPVAEVADAFVASLGRGAWSTDAGTHPHEAPTLALDATLARTTLGWRPRLDLGTSIEWTASWYRTQLEGGDVLGITDQQLAAYEELG